MRYGLRWTMAALCAGLPALGEAQVATSQPSAAAGLGPSAADIVITARRRDESLQEVPLTVNVLNGAALSNRNITSALDLSNVAPGLILSAGISNTPAVTVRGLGSNVVVASFEQSVPLFFDGIYAGRSRDNVAPLYDVQRIELIKGGQSTLLGKNSTLGALSLVTRLPGRDFGYDITASHEFKLNSQRIEAGVDLPLAEGLRARVAGIYSDEGGYVYNRFYDKDEPRTKIASGRVNAVWDGTDDLTVTLGYQYDRFRQKGQALEAISDPSGRLTAIATGLGKTDFETRLDGYVNNGTEIAGRPFDTQTGHRARAAIEYRLGDFTLSSLTGYVRWNNRRLAEIDFTTADLFDILARERNRQFSEEVRLASPADKPFNVVVGALYFHQKWDFGQTTTVRPPWPQNGAVDVTYDQRTRAYSGFGQANWAATGALSASLGLRFTREEKRGVGERTVVTPGPLLGPSPAFAPYVGNHDESNLDGGLNVQYEFAPRSIVYASASRGSKSGGFQNNPTSPSVAEYAGERAETVELGAKFTFGRGTFNAALFNTDVKDFQFTRLGPNGVIVDNIPLRSRGFEVEGTLRPLRGLSLAGALTYADAKDRTTGDRQPRAPKWSGNAEATYTTPLDDRLRFLVNGRAQVRSEYLTQLPSVRTPASPGHTLYDLRVAVGTQDESWEVAVLGRNLSDERPIIFASNLLYLPAGSFYGVQYRPRTIALQLTLKR